MPIKVLLLLNTKLIYYLAILRDYNYLVLRLAHFLILGKEVVLALEDKKG
jgi:hypothetical protein